MNAPISSFQQAFGDRAYQAIAKHVQHVLKQEDDVFADRDPEALHQMRVGMRRLRSDVTGFSTAIVLPNALSDRKIGKLARTLGNLRDLDVMQGSLRDRLLPAVPEDEQKAIEPALKALSKQRKSALKDAKKLLQGKAYNKFKGAAREWLGRPTYTPYAQFPVGDILPDVLLPSISRLLLEPGWWSGLSVDAEGNATNGNAIGNGDRLSSDDTENLHDLRKQAKRVRYLMTLFADLYSPTYQAYLADMKDLQSVLGELQDDSVTREFFAHTLGDDWAKNAPEFAAQLDRSRQNAWKRWQTLQSRYLSPQIRHVFRSEILRGYETGVARSEPASVSL